MTIAPVLSLPSPDADDISGAKARLISRTRETWRTRNISWSRHESLVVRRVCIDSDIAMPPRTWLLFPRILDVLLVVMPLRSPIRENLLLC